MLKPTTEPAGTSRDYCLCKGRLQHHGPTSDEVGMCWIEHHRRCVALL